MEKSFTCVVCDENLWLVFIFNYIFFCVHIKCPLTFLHESLYVNSFDTVGVGYFQMFGHFLKINPGFSSFTF